MTDLGFWVSWYNVRAEDRDSYLAWLHGVYIPKILKKPGVVWAAHYTSDKVKPPPHLRHTKDPKVPTGNDYVLFFGGETAHVFTKGSAAYMRGAPSKLEADLNPEDKKMLAKRVGERVCIFTEVARNRGPEWSKREGVGPTPCIQLGTFNEETPEVEDETLAWYADWRFDALGSLPGCVGVRQMVSVSGWAKHAVFYEFESRVALDANLPRLKDLYPDQYAWSQKCIPNLLHAPESPIVATRIWPPVK